MWKRAPDCGDCASVCSEMRMRAEVTNRLCPPGPPRAQLVGRGTGPLPRRAVRQGRSGPAAIGIEAIEAAGARLEVECHGANPEAAPAIHLAVVEAVSGDMRSRVAEPDCAATSRPSLTGVSGVAISPARKVISLRLARSRLWMAGRQMSTQYRRLVRGSCAGPSPIRSCYWQRPRWRRSLAAPAWERSRPAGAGRLP